MKKSVTNHCSYKTNLLCAKRCIGHMVGLRYEETLENSTYVIDSIGSTIEERRQRRKTNLTTT
jgi:hypothetical protein